MNEEFGKGRDGGGNDVCLAKMSCCVVVRSERCGEREPGECIGDDICTTGMVM